MKNFLLEFQQKAEKITILTEFIQTNPEARELQRALAIKMALQGEPYNKITQLLEMHKSCITTWKQKFESEGLEGIKLGYQGAKSYLTSEQRQEVITWLKTKNYWNIDELVNYLDEKYGVFYQSKQSYYELFSSAGISWKKSQKVNPKSNPEFVKKSEKRLEIFSPKTNRRLSLDTWLCSSLMSVIYFGVMFVDTPGVRQISELKSL